MEPIINTLDPIIQNQRIVNRNYKITYNEKYIKDKLCVIYFSSNGIYEPATKYQFINSIIDKDYYEWHNAPPVKKAYKNIFLRDTYRQWYIGGINEDINDVRLLIKFLQNETKDYKIITVGASAGGYAALLFGTLLNANKIFAFNPQVEINSFYKKCKINETPILYQYSKTENSIFYDLYDFIKDCEESLIYIFIPILSQWDKEQYQHIKNLSKKDNLCIINFLNSTHGIPFNKVIIPAVINKSTIIRLFKNKTLNPELFSLFIVLNNFYDIKFLKNLINRIILNKKYLKEFYLNLYHQIVKNIKIKSRSKA